MRNGYIGHIRPDENVVFVFGSNPEGRHGKGAAKVAVDNFGAIYGQGEGLQGNAYALPTKDLAMARTRGLYSQYQIDEFAEKYLRPYYRANRYSHVFTKEEFARSINPMTIANSIRKMYRCASEHPDKTFKVAYMGHSLDCSLNGYLNGEMMAMFNAAGPIPENVQFSKDWINSSVLENFIGGRF